MNKTVYLILLIALSSFTGFTTDAPPTQIEKVFTTSFPNVTSVKWKFERGYYYASFKYNEILTKIQYSKSGKLISSIRYYSAEILQPHLRNVVIKAFPESKILGVTELFEKQKLIYDIIVKKGSKLIRIQSNTEGDLDIISILTDASNTIAEGGL